MELERPPAEGLVNSPMTMEQLARLAGVSVSTVSRALRGHAGVKESTARQIRDLAVTHRFQVNQAAARLRRGRTQTVAVAVPTINAWYFAAMLAGAEAVLAEAGFDTLLVTVPPGSLERVLLDAGPQSGRVDGVIVADMFLSAPSVAALVASDSVVVTAGRELPRFSSVMIDDVEVGRTAADHLTALGHEVIGLITGLPASPYLFDVPEHRRTGFVAALDEAGIRHHVDLETGGRYSVLGGRMAAEQLLAVRPDLTALFCMSDEMAMGAIRALGDNGRRVPEDVSVVGVDDHELSAAVGLTTIRQDVVTLGARAARLLLASLADGNEVVHERLPGPLVVRRTTRRRQ